MLSLASIEEACESQGVSLVIHPAIRRAMTGYEESVHIGACCFLRGESDGLYFLPLATGGYARLVFSKRHSAGGHRILRIDPAAADGLERIKASLGPAKAL